MANHHRIGIIGIGAVAEMHALAIADIPDATLSVTETGGLAEPVERSRWRHRETGEQ